MEQKVLTVACVGCGARGEGYCKKMAKQPDKYSVVACCDINPSRAERFADQIIGSREQMFLDEKSFFEKKRADVCVVSTQDQDHVRHAILALELGYDLLLEKPISDQEEECRKLLEVQKRTGGKVLVCHVLRYALSYRKLKDLVDSGVIGQLVYVDHTEQVYFEHYAHSYVRGNWRKREETSPMILAKCCHDLDLLQWYIGSKCKTVSSFGSLTYFKKENQPKGASDRCIGCQYEKTCPYSASKIYIQDRFWGRYMVMDDKPGTDEEVYEELKTSRYGRCVFACDNNVVDHQTVSMEFENGVHATLKMLAFTGGQGRIIKFYGTLGEIDFDQDANQIIIKKFGTDDEILDLSTTFGAGNGHAGGDEMLVNALYDMILNEKAGETSLLGSVESHLMGFAAEKSRLNNGINAQVEHK